MSNNTAKKIPSDLFQPAELDLMNAEKISRPSDSFWKDARRRFLKNKGAMLGFTILGILLIFVLFGPMMSGHKYDDQDLKRAKLPPKIGVLENVKFLPFDGVDQYGIDQYEKKKVTENFWFGTDDLGRDIFTRTWAGARVSILIGLLAATIDMLIGVTFGGISGFYGGRVDTIMQRFAEILMGIPYLIVVILFILIFKNPGILSIALAMVITGWVSMSRIVRGQMLKLKNQEFVLASRTLGATNASLIGKHLIPNIMGPIIVMMMFTIPSAIFAEAFLSFIGLGIAPPKASLGSLVSDGFKSLQTFPHMMIIPAIVISLLILSFNLIADGLRDALDPKMSK
ncbi:oligopeptide ABC transporter permease [Gottfriedia solisilvae]|uniref:Peptide ABC transporter permease n=3 Tax=Bacteria TaxID=2 RepID=A0A8J3EZI0_9BACI|nr:oligopeptide ABC transporter permease [Gottfriedia solisilvae]GGI14974.1 peptide ABC transporter permease [Gottfriedia solisilvae]